MRALRCQACLPENRRPAGKNSASSHIPFRSHMSLKKIPYFVLTSRRGFDAKRVDDAEGTPCRKRCTSRLLRRHSGCSGCMPLLLDAADDNVELISANGLVLLYKYIHLVFFPLEGYLVAASPVARADGVCSILAVDLLLLSMLQEPNER